MLKLDRLTGWRRRRRERRGRILRAAEDLEAEHGRGQAAAYYAAMARMNAPGLSPEDLREAREVFEELAGRHRDHMEELKRS